MNPYLSVVMGVGGKIGNDLLDRLSESIAKITILCERMCLEAEIVIVIWNAPNFKARSAGGLSPHCSARFIQTGDLHSRIPNPHGFPYFEMAPKNIGIRRAHGEFVLATNPDDLWSDDLAAFFARRQLQHDHFYRVNRHDTRDGKVFRVCRAAGTYPPDASEEQTHIPAIHGCPWSLDMLHFNASGDFMLMSKDDWFKIYGNPEREYNHTVDGQTVWLAHTMGLKQIVLPYPIYHPDHERTLNIADGKFFGPDWDDKTPHTKQNGEDWGFAGVEFEETVL